MVSARSRSSISSSASQGGSVMDSTGTDGGTPASRRVSAAWSQVGCDSFPVVPGPSALQSRGSSDSLPLTLGGPNRISRVSEDSQPPTYARASTVTPNSRVLVRGAQALPEANGMFCIRQAAARPGQRESLGFVKVGDHRLVITWSRKAQALDDRAAVRRETRCYIARLAKPDSPGTSGVGEVVRLYGADCQSTASLRLCGWYSCLQGSTTLGQQEPSLEILDVGDFQGLLSECGLWTALFIEMQAIWHAGSHGNVHQAASESRVYAAGEDDHEVFEVGNAVVVHDSETCARRVVKEAGLAWDNRIPTMLGQSFKVIKVIDAQRIVVRLPPETYGFPNQMELPAILVDRDFSDIWSFYTHRPVFIVVQTSICVALWLLFAIMDTGRSGKPFTETMGGLESVWPGQTSLLISKDCEDFRGQIWRLLSYQFSHVGLAHIFMNAFVNLLLGIELEKFQGSLRMAAMYECGVFGGACCYLISDGHRPVVGTSGGCFSLIGMRFGDLLMNWHERPYRYLRLVFLILLIVVNIAAEGLNEPEGGTTTSHSAHVGGAVAGFIASVILGRNLKLTNMEVMQIGLAVVVGIAAVLFCLGRGMQWPPQNLFEDAPWCWMRQVSNASLFGTWDWKCVRCHSDACIEEWSLQRRMYGVIEDTCHERGGFAYTESV